jgi:2,3-bisphosphoglycerate-independent phosphoglycerate mutase
MKYAIVLMDGAADEPLEELGGLTVLEKAEIPHIDWISKHGQLGMAHTVPESFSPGSDIAIMSVLGYDPTIYHTGRAPLEAAAQSIATGPGEWIFRCNLVTIADGLMLDHSAGHIQDVQGKQLLNDIGDALSCDDFVFYPGVSYRHLLVHRKGPFKLQTTPPHDILDQPAEKYFPKGKGAKGLCELMDRGREILANHEINKVRRDLGENPATDIWFWGQGTRPQMDNFRKRFGCSASLITAVDLVRGLGKLIGMNVVEVEGATGYLDTNYVGKGQAAIDVLGDQDLVFVHIEAPDEAGHGGLMDEKIESIEKIDEHIVGPLLNFFQNQSEDWRIMVLPDHPTPIRIRTHVREPIPFAVAGTGVSNSRELSYSEKNGLASGLEIQKGHELMEYFLKG